MQFLEKSRVRPKSGDIFVLQIAVVFHFGRVLRTDAKSALIDLKTNFVLVLIFRQSSAHPEFSPEIENSGELFRPRLINRQGWLQGYFKTVAHKPLTEEENSRVYFFRVSPNGESYYNDRGEKVERPDGEYTLGYGIGNHLTIEERIKLCSVETMQT